jgi:hypothetical protein
MNAEEVKIDSSSSSEDLSDDFIEIMESENSVIEIT